MNTDRTGSFTNRSLRLCIQLSCQKGPQKCNDWLWLFFSRDVQPFVDVVLCVLLPHQVVKWRLLLSSAVDYFCFHLSPSAVGRISWNCQHSFLVHHPRRPRRPQLHPKWGDGRSQRLRSKLGWRFFCSAATFACIVLLAVFCSFCFCWNKSAESD